jgi:tRNA-2-methylthio-N6-dimethylallyladenosine synthase
MESVLNECLDLTENGYKEVTLIGQNIDAYGRDMTPKRTFAELLEYLNSNLPRQTRIRYVTSHPRYFSDRVIDAVANLDKGTSKVESAVLGLMIVRVLYINY